MWDKVFIGVVIAFLLMACSEAADERTGGDKASIMSASHEDQDKMTVSDEKANLSFQRECTRLLHTPVYLACVQLNHSL